MSRLSRFAGRPEEHDIDGEKFKFYPLGAKDQDLLYNLSDVKRKTEALRGIIKLSLKDEKDLQDEEIDGMLIGVKNKMVEIIINVNGMGEQLAKVKQEYSGKS